MKGLLVNHSTRSQLDNYLVRPSHALLLAGPSGSGRLAVAESLAQEILKSTNLDNNANFRLVVPDEKGNISIEIIRQLKQFVRLKSASRRVIIINDADCMLLPAQNSFLKLLEEPPEGVFMILLAPAGNLKPTILSRLQTITIRPVDIEAVERYFDKYPTEAVRMAYQVSGGRVGLIKQLLDRPDDHPLWTAANAARNVLGVDLFKKLSLVDSLTKDKDLSISLLEIIDRMAQSALGVAVSLEAIKRWQRVLAASREAQESITNRANLKLTLTNLMLNL